LDAPATLAVAGWDAAGATASVAAGAAGVVAAGIAAVCAGSVADALVASISRSTRWPSCAVTISMRCVSSLASSVASCPAASRIASALPVYV
jgi:hypothetical protein